MIRKKKEGIPKNAVEKKKISPKPSTKNAVEKKKISPKPSTKNAVENKKISPKPSTKNAVENKKISPKPSTKNAVEKKKISPKPSTKNAVEKKKISPKPSTKNAVEKKKISPKPSPKISVEKKKIALKKIKIYSKFSPKLAKKGGNIFDYTLKLIPDVLTYTNKMPITETISELIKIVKQQLKVKLQDENKNLEKSFAVSINLKNGNTENIVSLVDNFKTKNTSYFNLDPNEYKQYKMDIASINSKQYEIFSFDDLKKFKRSKNEERGFEYIDNNEEEVLLNNYDDLFNINSNDVLEEIINRTNLPISLQKGGYGIKSVRKTKYRGGNNIKTKIEGLAKKLKETINDTVFGISVDIPEDQKRIIDADAIDFKNVIKQIAEDDIKKRNLSTKAIKFINIIISNEQILDRLVKSFCSKKIIEYASANSRILTIYKNKINSYTNILKSIQYVNSNFTKLYRPNQKFYVYGMQLPHQFDRVCLLATMYKLNCEGIYSIVDLEDCNSGINIGNKMIGKGIGCNPFDRDCEIDMWSLAISTADLSKLPNNATYYGIEYLDMSEGTLHTWNSVSNIKNIIDKKNKIVIHCLVGAGRSGCVILYLLMRDFYLLESNTIEGNSYVIRLKDEMKKRYFGMTSLKTFIEKRLISYYYTITDDDKLSDNKDSIKWMLSEIFELGENNDDISSIELFRKRLNYIIVFLARHFNIIEFVTYHNSKFEIKNMPESIQPGIIQNDNIPYIDVSKEVHSSFCNSHLIKIDSWENYIIEDFMDNPDHDKYKEVMCWIN